MKDNVTQAENCFIPKATGNGLETQKRHDPIQKARCGCRMGVNGGQGRRAGQAGRGTGWQSWAQGEGRLKAVLKVKPAGAGQGRREGEGGGGGTDRHGLDIQLCGHRVAGQCQSPCGHPREGVHRWLAGGSESLGESELETAHLGPPSLISCIQFVGKFCQLYLQNNIPDLVPSVPCASLTISQTTIISHWRVQPRHPAFSLLPSGVVSAQQAEGSCS